MVQIWSSRGYLLSSIMQEKVNFNLKILSESVIKKRMQEIDMIKRVLYSSFYSINSWWVQLILMSSVWQHLMKPVKIFRNLCTDLDLDFWDWITMKFRICLNQTVESWGKKRQNWSVPTSNLDSWDTVSTMTMVAETVWIYSIY